MPRALLLFEFSTLNGGERSLLAVLPHLQHAGWHFDALAPASGPLADALQRCGVRRVGDGIDGLDSALRTGQYDLLHANSLTAARRSGPQVAAAGLPSLGHLRDMMKLNASAVAALNAHTRLLAVSGATRDFHIAQGVDPTKLHVVYNGVRLDFGRPGHTTPQNPSAPRRTIGLIGQIILRKGQETALRAVVEVMQSRPDVDAVLIGARHSEKPETREYENRLHAIVDAAGMTARVRFLGTRDDVESLLPTFALLLHTPRQEPLGRVLLEAAACGVPVVATEVGGTREIFPRDQRDGAILVPVDDPTAAAAACGRLLDDAPLAAEIGAAGRRRIEAAFAVERAAGELLRHYDEVSGRSGLARKLASP